LTLLQALLVFWLGGAVAFASIATAWSRAVPEQVEEIGLTTFALIYGTLFWPWALWQGYVVIKEQQRERARRRCPEGAGAQ